ncbi:MAG: hypothetical protein KA821_18125, partial [Chitinophagaceae bacterium]|nr:hypothetical protein [Chitinophagaceae bacterium]
AALLAILPAEFNDGDTLPGGIAYTEPYPGLFIPQHTELWPRITDSDWSSLQRWPVQVMHPQLGFTGFDTADQVDWINLLQEPAMDMTSWDLAQEGQTAVPAFTAIRLKATAVPQLLDQLKTLSGIHSFDDLPKPKRQWPAWMRRVAYWLLRLLQLILKLFAGLIMLLLYPFAQLEGKKPSAAGNYSNQSDDWLTSLLNWTNKGINNLESQRTEELNRLLKMFEKNPDEAIKYALPLNSPYLNRGKAKAGGRLQKNRPLFNIGSLGGGFAADYWNADSHADRLRSSYIAQAKKAIENNDHRKAAYIYANLLGDYNEAARVLENGRHYRDAAILYKDHLKNPAAAARCLEEGQLYQEAIDIYRDLNQYEKVGDLYQKINNPKAATVYYEKELEKQLAAHDLLSAGTLTLDKINDVERAQQFWLKGWEQQLLPQACLEKFILVRTGTENESAHDTLRHIYQHHSTPAQYGMLLEICSGHLRNTSDEHGKTVIRNMAYEMTAAMHNSGAKKALLQLGAFFPEDKLVASDCSRYLFTQRQNVEPEKAKTSHSFELSSEIEWLGLWHCHTQLLAVGRRTQELVLARFDFNGHTEYYHWPLKDERFVNNPILLYSFNSKWMVLLPNWSESLTEKKLLKNKYFPSSLEVFTPDWIYHQKAICMGSSGNLLAMNLENGEFIIREYDRTGTVVTTVVFESGQKEMNAAIFNSVFYEGREGYWFGQQNSSVFYLQKRDTIAYELPLESVIRCIGHSGLFPGDYVVASTNRGCFLLTPDQVMQQREVSPFNADSIPIAITFVGANRFMLLEKKQALLYHIVDRLPHFIKVFKIRAGKQYVSAIPGHHAGQVMLLTDSGKFEWHDTDDEV